MSDAVSLTMGNSLLPFGHRLPHHMKPQGHLLLGQSFFLPQLFQVFSKHHFPSYAAHQYSKGAIKTQATQTNIGKISASSLLSPRTS